MLDCTGENCCPESFLGDDFCDEFHDYCDLTCFDNDGGDCEEVVDNDCDYENDEECCLEED